MPAVKNIIVDKNQSIPYFPPHCGIQCSIPSKVCPLRKRLPLSCHKNSWQMFDATKLWKHTIPLTYNTKILISNSGIARAFPGGRLAHPDNRNEEENKENLKKNEKNCQKMRKDWGNVLILPNREWKAGYGPDIKHIWNTSFFTSNETDHKTTRNNRNFVCCLTFNCFNYPQKIKNQHALTSLKKFFSPLCIISLLQKQIVQGQLLTMVMKKKSCHKILSGSMIQDGHKILEE